MRERCKILRLYTIECTDMRLNEKDWVKMFIKTEPESAYTFIYIYSAAHIINYTIKQ